MNCRHVSLTIRRAVNGYVVTDSWGEHVFASAAEALEYIDNLLLALDELGACK